MAFLLLESLALADRPAAPRDPPPSPRCELDARGVIAMAPWSVVGRPPYSCNGENLICSCFDIHVFVCDLKAIWLRRMEYSINCSARPTVNSGILSAARSSRTVRFSVNSGVFF
jgi:hypothetical protein